MLFSCLFAIISRKGKRPMKLYLNLLKLLFNKIILRKNNGECLKTFCENMGVAYIKLAQILAMQNYGDLFIEKDRLSLSSLCDYTMPIPFLKIKEILEKEYGSLDKVFKSIEESPLGAASISQVHKATLLNGEVVAIKIKRKDITYTLESDIRKMRVMITKYVSFLEKHSWFQKWIQKHISLLDFHNLLGGEKALDIYYHWIILETDFRNEQQNILNYEKFIQKVNTYQIKPSIVIPRIYEDLCTENVIVMEYIPNPTIKYLEKNEENQEKIKKAINNYILLSFKALLKDEEVIFHGDPHEGNLYLDESGNLGFLDMGLTFSLSKGEREYTRNFFIAVYTRNANKIFELISSFSTLTSEEKRKLKEDLNNYCQSLGTKNITNYFIDMVNICLKYNVAPPEFFYKMAKAFICLNGLNKLMENNTSALTLLKKEALEYLIMKNLNDTKKLAINCLNIAPKLLKSTLKYGLRKTLKESKDLPKRELLQMKYNLETLYDLIKLELEEETRKR